MTKENTPSNIHIGSLIRAKAAERGISETKLALMINCHISTVHYIYERETINSEQLWKISIALNYNFFTETYGISLTPLIENHENNSTINIIIASDKVIIEKKNGITQITEYRIYSK